MLDTQFSSQNGGTVAGVPPGGGGNGTGTSPAGITPVPGISLIVAPPLNATPEPHKWVVVEQLKDSRKIQVTDNMTTVDRVVLCASEFTGTAILVFLGCMGCVADVKGPQTHLAICLTFGLAVMVSVQTFGHVSGSHINPIVTVAAATLGTIPLIQVPIYFTGQLLGAFGGFGLLKAVTPSALMPVGHYKNVTIDGVGVMKWVSGVCSPEVNPGISSLQGLLVEFTISFILVLVCCGVWDVRNAARHDSVAIKFGLTIAVLALAGGPYTGANMNPVRSFAPALFNGDWANHWVYWLGPLGAGFLGALFYRFLFWKEPGADDDRNNIPEAVALNDKA